jgi:hypothetical protein
MPQKPFTFDEVAEIIGRVKFLDRTFRVIKKEVVEGEPVFLVQLTYWEADVEDLEGKALIQASRKWYVSPFSTATEVVETCYAACLRSMKHVVREHFIYRGRRVMSPHFDIEDRVRMCDEKRYDVRESL